MMQDTMVGKKFGNLVVQKLAYRGKDSKKYWEKKDDEPLAGSYRAEVRETCGPAAGESG